MKQRQQQKQLENEVEIVFSDIVFQLVFVWIYFECLFTVHCDIAKSNMTCCVFVRIDDQSENFCFRTFQRIELILMGEETNLSRWCNSSSGSSSTVWTPEVSSSSKVRVSFRLMGNLFTRVTDSCHSPLERMINLILFMPVAH